jgi:hypothetical protein
MVRCFNGLSFWLFFFLQSYLKGINERYPEIFEGGGFEGHGSESAHQANFARKWSAYQSIVVLANDNLLNFDEIVKRPLEECLLNLCYRADKSQLEGLLHRQAMKKYK